MVSEPPVKVPRVEAPLIHSDSEQGDTPGNEGSYVTEQFSHQEETKQQIDSEKTELYKELMSLFNENIGKASNAKRKAYSDAIRKFSITMFSYSPQAYR